MKTLSQKLMAITAILFMLSSCGSSIQSDAQKVADLQCEAQELMQKAISGDASLQQEAQKLLSKSQSLANEMNSKYSSMEEKQEFQQALLKASRNCN